MAPPTLGTARTCVQLLTLLYHNYPGQRTLVVAHSNQALNDVFQKTIERDVPARYLLRLGMGQEDLDTDVDFSRTGASRPRSLSPAAVHPRAWAAVGLLQYKRARTRETAARAPRGE